MLLLILATVGCFGQYQRRIGGHQYRYHDASVAITKVFFCRTRQSGKKVVNDIKQFGFVQRGWLGVEIENIDDMRARKLQIPEVAGVYIAVVTRNGAAYDAGLKVAM